MKKLTLLGALAVALQVNAQIQPGPMIAGVESDINYLTSGYLGPLGDAVNTGMNNAWHTQARSSNLGGFEVQISPMVMLIPNAQQSFTIRNSELQELQLADPNDNVTPTAFGPDEPGVTLEYKDETLPISLGDTEFDMPAGYGFSAMPLGNFQANVGVGFNTDIRLRYLPEMPIPNLPDTRINLYGVGLSHQLDQYIPVLPLSISVVGGYTNLSFVQQIEGGDDRELTLDTEAWTARLLVSKKLLFFTIYGGAGYNAASTRIQMKGTYNYIDPTKPQDPEQELKDPVDFTRAGVDGLIANVGFRLDFLRFFFFNADYTMGPFDSVTAGIGVSF